MMCRHNPDPFSKFTFLSQGYKDYDMSNLDITNTRYKVLFVLVNK
jgi:hypothetical protein